MICHVFRAGRSCAAAVPGITPPVPVRLPGFSPGLPSPGSGHGVSPFCSRFVPTACRRRDPDSRVSRARGRVSAPARFTRLIARTRPRARAGHSLQTGRTGSGAAVRARCRRREFQTGAIGIAPARKRGAGATGSVTGCHDMSCFPCRAVMRCGRSGHEAVGSGPASGFFSGVICLRVRGTAFLLSTPASFLSPAGGGTLIRAFRERAGACRRRRGSRA